MKDVETITGFGQYLHWSQMQYEHYRSFQENSAPAEIVGALVHWLASLYVVAEGWQEIGMPDSVISDLIAKYDDYYQLMRRFRNSVYHFQHKVMSEKLTDFLGATSEGILWAEALLFEFKRFLVFTVPNDADGEEMKLMIGWWPRDFLVRVKAVRGGKYGEINPAMTFLSRISHNVINKRSLAVKLYEEKNHTVDQICQMMGISKPTLYKYIAADRDANS